MTVPNAPSRTVTTALVLALLAAPAPLRAEPAAAEDRRLQTIDPNKVPPRQSQLKCEQAAEAFARTASVSIEQARALAAFAVRNEVQIVARPLNKDALQRRAENHPPKPESVKEKTCGERDVALGAPSDCLGLVVLFKPKLPEDPKLMGRYHQRLKEWDAAHDPTKRNNLHHVDAQTGVITIDDKKTHRPLAETRPFGGDLEGGYVVDLEAGKAYTGDLDLFEMLDRHGRQLAAKDRDRLDKLLQAATDVDVLHGMHMDWEPETDGDAAGKAAIIRGHRPVKDPSVLLPGQASGGGEMLAKLSPDCSVCETYAASAAQRAAYTYPCHERPTFASRLKLQVGDKRAIAITPEAALAGTECWNVTITKAAWYGGELDGPTGSGSYEYRKDDGATGGSDHEDLEARVCR